VCTAVMKKPPRPRPASAAGRLGSRNRGSAVLNTHPEFRDFKWMPMECEFNRASVDGCVKKPKLRSDEAKLKELFVCCRAANFREVRAIAFHFPYLLAMTDNYGFTALHHAEMSGDAEFMEKLLVLYNEPRASVRKFVRYECEEDLRCDGFRLNGGRSSMHSREGSTPNQSHHSTPIQSARESACITVRLVAPNSIAAAAGVVPGDTLEAVEGALVNGLHRVMVAPDDISAAMNDGQRLEDGYPMTLEFRGAASAEILGRDSWTPLHAAEGGGAHYKKVSRVLRQEQQKLPTAARDGHGCTPEHWAIINKRGSCGPRRRPLSAGPCPQRRPSLGAVQQTWEREGGSATQQVERPTAVSAVNTRLRQRLLPKSSPSPPAPPPPPLSP